MSCSCTTANISIYQGSNFSFTTTLVDSNSYVNLSGYYCRGTVKYKYSQTGYVLNLSPKIVSYESGLIVFTGDPITTAAIPCNQYIYSVEIVSSGGYVSQVLHGDFIVNPETTTIP